MPILLFGLYLAYFYFSNREEVPLTGRSQLVDLTREQENALGLHSYREILSQSRVVTGGQNLALLREVGGRIAAAAASEDPGFDWEFNLIDAEQANAFALPGGKVAVYEGLLPIAASADGLAIVLGHEIAHAVARHGAERMAYQRLAQIGGVAASVALGDMGISTQRAVMGALGVGAQVGVLLPFSRKHESEADYIGLIYAARACFDPREAPALWERMAERADGRQASDFVSTHPAPEKRQRQFEEWMPEALAIREQFCAI